MRKFLKSAAVVLVLGSIAGPAAYVASYMVMLDIKLPPTFINGRLHYCGPINDPFRDICTRYF